MASGAIDNWRVRHVLSVVDHDSPDLDESEESNVGKLLKWEHEWEKVVRHALAVSVERVESVRGVWCRHDPLVVRLVESLVDKRVVQATMDPVDAEVGKHQEQRELNIVVPSPNQLRNGCEKPALVALS